MPDGPEIPPGADLIYLRVLREQGVNATAGNAPKVRIAWPT